MVTARAQMADVRPDSGAVAAPAVRLTEIQKSYGKVAAAGRVIEECYREGVIVLKAGTFDNVIRLLPPLSIDEGLLREGLDVLDKALTAATA